MESVYPVRCDTFGDVLPIVSMDFSLVLLFFRTNYESESGTHQSVNGTCGKRFTIELISCTV